MSPLLHLPEDILISIVVQFLDISDVVRLRQTHTLLRRISHTRIVWVMLYKKSSLPLPAFQETLPTESLENNLVCATRLDWRLRSPNVTSRVGWKVTHPFAYSSDTVVIEGGRYAVVALREGFQCVNLDTRVFWRIPIEKPAYQFEASLVARKYTENGREGIIMGCMCGGLGKEYSLYFQPIDGDESTPREDAYKLVTVHTSSRFSTASISDDVFAAASVTGEITVLDLGSKSIYTIEAGEWLISKISICGPYIAVAIAFQEARIHVYRNPFLSPDGEISEGSAIIPYPSDLYAGSVLSFTSNAMALKSSASDAHMFFLDTAPLNRQSVLRFVVSIQPSNHSRILNVQSYSWNSAPSFSNEMFPFSPHFHRFENQITLFHAVSFQTRIISVLISLHSQSTPFVITNVQPNGQLVHSKVLIHDAELEALTWQSGRYAWDELSGRLCVTSAEENALVVLEF